jgi:mating pheromone-induced death protein 2
MPSSGACAASSAAPSATAAVGSTSLTIGQPIASDTILDTSGIRLLPPCSNTASSMPGPAPAAFRARCNAPMLDSIDGRITYSKSSRLMKTSKAPSGSSTVSLAPSLSDSSSLASAQSLVSRASAPGACRSRSSKISPPTSRTRLASAVSKSMPPSRSTPPGTPSSSTRPSNLRSTVRSRLPPPRSYTAVSWPSAIAEQARRTAMASGLVTSIGSISPAKRVICWNAARSDGPQRAG